MMRRGIGRGGPGLLGVAARTAVISGTATAVSGNVARRQQGKAMQAQAAAAHGQQQAAPPPPAPVPAAGPEIDVIGQLKELAALKEAGILTEAEFEAQKARILA